jgi:hypothetical protein
MPNVVSELGHPVAGCCAGKNKPTFARTWTARFVNHRQCVQVAPTGNKATDSKRFTV